MQLRSPPCTQSYSLASYKEIIIAARAPGPIDRRPAASDFRHGASQPSDWRRRCQRTHTPPPLNTRAAVMMSARQSAATAGGHRIGADLAGSDLRVVGSGDRSSGAGY